MEVVDRTEGAVPEDLVACGGVDDGEAFSGFGTDDEAVRPLRLSQQRAEENR